ncbi:MAG: hypothetical protein L0220_03330 [Acidobacteria bacterium]|nr:hypothetical protein [Acidobacteriota bacterium]
MSSNDRHEGGEVITGELHCSRCRQCFMIREGIPRFTNPSGDLVQRNTAANFGAQWPAFNHLDEHHEKQFLDWIHNIVHNHLTAPIAFYVSREEFGRWFETEQTERSQIYWHNHNSWRGMAFRRSTSDAK